MSSLKKCKAQIYILEKNGTEIFILFLRKSLILALKCRDFRKSQKAKPHIFFRTGPTEKAKFQGFGVKKPN